MGALDNGVRDHGEVLRKTQWSLIGSIFPYERSTTG
jgi:hypothetical protein